MSHRLALAALLAAFVPQLFAAPELSIPFDKFELANGLTVIVHEDRKAPVVAVAVWYKVGSKDEPEGKSGFAHLFEHLMFNGSENYDDEWFKPLKEVGATGLNGTTSFDRTNYFQTVPTPALDRILWMESDRMGHFVGAITQEKLDEQRGVVQNEKRQGENQPYGRQVFTNIQEALFPSEHPYHHSTIGSMDDLDAATLEDVKGWFEQYYGPSNAILVLAGDIDAEEARPLVEKYFGDIEPGPPLTRWEAWVPERGANTRSTMFDQVPQARIYRVWLAPPATDPVSEDLFIAASVLGDGKNSRLYRELVYDRQIATDASVFNFEQQLASVFGVVVSVKPGEDVATVEAAMEQIIAEFLEEGPTKDEVELVSTKTRAGIIRGLEEVGGFGGKAVTLAQGELLAGDPGFYQTELEQLERATREGVKEAARTWLSAGWHQLDVVPFPEYAAAGEGVDRSTGLPPVSGETELSFPPVATATLANGMTVHVATRRTIPVVNVALRFDAGYAADPADQLGLANFTTAMLDEGAGKYDALALAAELEKLGATLAAGSSLDSTTVSLSALKENLAPSLALLGDVVRRPTFPEADIERQRALILNAIGQEKANPISIAIRLLPPLMFGDGHPYGIPLTGSGSEAAVDAIDREDLVSFKERWMRPDNSAIFVVGDTTLEEILPLLDKTFGGWQAEGEAPTKAIDDVALPAGPRTVIIDRPGSPQSLILAGHVAPPTGIENNIAIEAMNEILGGGFVSRINLNLREDKGWSYGSRAILADAKAQRPFIVLAPVQTDKTGASLAELQKELAAIVDDEPPTAEELERVVLDNVRSLPGQFETAGAVLGSMLASHTYGRSFDYPETLPSAYRSLTPEDVAAAADQVLAPDRMVWVIIGDAEKIRAEVEAAGVGPVEVRAMSSL